MFNMFKKKKKEDPMKDEKKKGMEEANGEAEIPPKEEEAKAETEKKETEDAPKEEKAEETAETAKEESKEPESDAVTLGDLMKVVTSMAEGMAKMLEILVAKPAVEEEKPLPGKEELKDEESEEDEDGLENFFGD